MKNFCISFLFLFLSYISSAQIINFSDPNFKAVLLMSSTSNSVAINSAGTSIKIDANNDNEIQVSEALDVVQLDVSTNSMQDITSMAGIQYFTNLTYLDCSRNAMTSLDVTALSNLEFLQANYGALTSLNVSGLTNLKKLYCYSNAINSLDLTGLFHLERLYCENNFLTHLDFNGLTSLKYIVCRNNQLTSITNMANLGIREMSCSNNDLTSLDLTGLTSLIYFGAENNNLSAIDLSQLAALESAFFKDNPLTSLNLKGLPVLWHLNVSNTLLASIDCSQTGVIQLFATDCANLRTINVRNGIQSYSDPDMLYFAFRIYNNPQLVSICTDNNEQNQLALTDYNTSGSVEVYNGPNCDIPVSVNMAVPALDKERVKLYPNPASDIINILADNQAISQTMIHTLLGQVVMTFNSQATIDISPLKKGTYLITVETDLGAATRKLVKL